MATERLPMRKIREILRLRGQQGLSVREAARALGVSVGVVSKTASRAEKAGVSWAVAEGLNDAALDERLYGRAAGPSDDRPRPDPVYLLTELRRAGVTLELLHLEQHPTGLRYTAFCDDYRKWLAKTSVTMRQLHKAGDKCFVDFSGVRPVYLDATSGEQEFVELFVAVLGASNLTYAEVVSSQKVEDFVGAHVRALAYFGGAPAIGRARRIEGGGDRAVLIRTGDPAHVRGVCAPLWNGRGAGTAVQSARQGEGRGGRSDCAAVDPCAASERDLLLARGAECSGPRAARGAQRAPNEEARRYQSA